MELVEKQITIEKLKEMSARMFGDLVKGVVDVQKGILVVDAELHSDLEAYLLELGSKQENLWGINIYPDLSGDDMLEFDSMINLRPSLNNFTRGVEDEEIRTKILAIVNSKIDGE